MLLGVYAQDKKSPGNGKEERPDHGGEKVESLDWDDMEEIALGQLGMTESGLWSISPRSLFNKINGARFIENQQWERMRIHAHLMLMPYMDKNKPISPQDLLKFPWDKQIKVMGKKEKNERHKRANKIWARIDEQKNRDVEQ